MNHHPSEMIQAAQRGDLSLLISLMNQGTHHGRPGVNGKTKQEIARTMLDTYQRHPDEMLEMARTLAKSSLASAREIACLLFRHLLPENESLLHEVLLLAMDEDWEVREWSVHPLTTYCLKHYPNNLQLLEQLCTHSNASVQRQMALVIKHIAHRRLEDNVSHLLHLVEYLVPVEAEYVRINLGQFCIGDGLLPIYPHETLRALDQWSCSPMWPVRWNVAMAFTSADSRRFAAEASDILSRLDGDTDKRVRAAARKGRKNLAQGTASHSV